LIPVLLAGHELMALVDTGVTHNFMPMALAKELKLSVTAPPAGAAFIKVASPHQVPR
jgi:hypothetical protein